MRERLTLASVKTAADTVPTKPIAEAIPAKPAAKRAKPAARPHDPTVIREFLFPDGRPIALHRHTVRWATPLKDDPERATLVATKDGEKPLPLQVSYTSFMAWWLA